MLLLLSLSGLGFSLIQLSQHWDYENVLIDLEKSLQKNITADDISQEINAAIEASEFDDARQYLAIAKANHYKIDVSAFEASIQEKDTALRQLVVQASSFGKGFVQGKGSNTAGVAGSIAADFTVIGDARDLSQEFSKYQKGDEINELIVVLSGAGIGLTAFTLGTGGAAAPVKAGTSVMKVAVKTQRLSRPFQKHLLRLGRQIFDWPAFTRVAKNNKGFRGLQQAAKKAYHPKALNPLKKIATRVNNIRKQTSTVDTVHLLQYIDAPKDLLQLEKVSLKYGAKTKGMMKLVGKSGIRTVRVLKKTTLWLIALVGSVLSAFLSLLLLFNSFLSLLRKRA